AALSAYTEKKNTDVSAIEANFNNEKKQTLDALNGANVQIQELNRQLASANTRIQTLETKLGENRINTQDPITRHPDGKIIRIPAKDIVYIDIGAAEAVTEGLTFEVYDKVQGIPPVGDPTTEDHLP